MQEDLSTQRFRLLPASVRLGLSLTLGAFVVLVFALTVVKVKRGEPMQGYDHVVQPESAPLVEGQP